MKIKILIALFFISGASFSQSGTHLQVQGRKIIGTCGDTVILKGINYAPYNWGYTAGENYFDQIALTKANCVRIVWYKNSTSSIYNNLVYLDSALARCVRAKMIPVLVLHDATCTGNMADVTALLPFYTSAAFKALELKYRKHLIINIANEAGQYAWAANPTTALNTYKTTYQSAITTLRSNGLQVPLMIDAPDCGTNSDAIVNAGAQIITSDILANTMFSVHGYWYGFAGNNPVTMQTKVQALYNSGLCIYFGEVANQQDDANPCQYNLAYTQLLSILKSFNIGWTAWGWYNDVCPLRQISNNGNANNLSAYGQVIVNDPTVGLMATAVQALQFNATCGNTCAVTATVSTQAVVCFGSSTGSATITLSGSGAAASGFYSKDGGGVIPFSANPFTVSGFTAGIHTIVLTNIGTSNCTASTGNFTINGPASAISTSFSAAACNSYVWQGTTYTTSGAKVKVLTSSKGCDSTVTLNLTIKNATSSNSNISVCANALPFIWNGISCSTGGLYTAHLINSVGCDSAATLNLTIKSLTSSTTEITVCPIQLPFSWNGINCNASGNYTAHLINSVGCDSAATVQLTVNTFSAGEISGNSGACAFTGAGTPNAVYTITATTGAAFVWTVPSGATMVSGQGTNSISVKYDATFLNGNISVTVSNSCGNAIIKTFAITKAIPSTPVISGPANACIFIGTNTPVTYSINPVPNASSYRWTLPANVTLLSASSDSLQVTFTFNSNFAAGTSAQKTIRVKAISGCGNSADKTLSILTTQPAAPVYLTGPTNACTNMFPFIATYVTKKVANASGYIWTVPPTGATIISHPAGTGPNDTVITVQYNNLFPATPSATVDFVGVSATSPCGTSLPKKLNISRKAPAAAGIITGPTDICSQMIGTTNITGTVVTYSIRKIADAVSYNWTIPAIGATIVSHPAGPGINDTIIQVLFNAALPVSGGQISVKGVNTCTTGTAKTITVKPVLPATPGTISGTVDACNNIFTGTDATYTIRKVNLATGYNWSTLNSTAGGAGSISITGHPGGTGINDTIVTVHFGSGYLTGALKVQAVRNCGVSLQKTLSILTKKVAAPAAISGNATPCIGVTEVYSCTLVNNASGYNWTVPVNAQILNGQGSNQITVLYPGTDLLFKNGSIGVTAVSPCGASTIKTLAITKCLARNINTELTPTTKTGVTVFPNPANGKFTITLSDYSLSTSWNIEIVDEYGTVVFQKKITNITGNIKIPVTENLPAGLYFINSTSEKEKITCRLVYAGR